MKNKELVKKLNDLQIHQTTGDWAESLPDNIWEDNFEGQYSEVEEGLDVDTHRWYETSVTVVKINDGFIGINYITNTFSESTYIEDCYHHLVFSEMKEITVTSYKNI